MPSLSDIIGQDQALLVLRRALESKRLAHAYLFCGPEGVGKATCARLLFAALNCEVAPGEGCGGCASCYKVEAGLHPDLVHLVPEGQFIKIGQVRALEEQLAFLPHEGRHRVVIVDRAEDLNLSAANALLKSVEEPRPRTLFVLVTAAAHRVPATLLSRCQRVRFVPLSTDLVERVIARHAAASEEQRRAAAALAEGSPSRALKRLEGDQLAAIQRTADLLLAAASGGEASATFAAAGEVGRDRALVTETLDVLRVRLRDLLLCREGLDAGRVAPGAPAEQARGGAAHLTTTTILGQLRAVNEAQLAVRGNVSTSLTVENLVLCMRQAAAR